MLEYLEKVVFDCDDDKSLLVLVFAPVCAKRMGAQGGRLVVAASGLFAALGEQIAFSFVVESECNNYAQISLWNMAERYQNTP